MAADHFLRLGSITAKRGGILGAMRHNKRMLPNDQAHIDITRTALNYSLVSDEAPDIVARHAKVQMAKADIEPRKNCVLAVEVVFSLPVNNQKQSTAPFFTDCHEWVKTNFDGELLAFDVHHDEAAIHAHAIILPLIDGEMRGNKLIGSPYNWIRLQKKFGADIGARYGLSFTRKKRLSNSDRQTLEQLVLKRLEGDPVMLSSIWPIDRDNIHKDPERYAQLLGIELPLAEIKSSKSFVDHKRSHGKGSFIR